ncbi:hypothetical protein [Sphingomonas sp. M1-B02]|uniref:hypothetical protein n=1 Tax=Sphingomonas sp. M1-B02 TaxID=3114300 RepID=UPI00223F383C|nr:hypothetical protein [Sphingomonas sp. S6-11]UZK66605.1 hypothetical protein OKW87_01825 [Sphingomonas sp. S6-11]
MEPNPSQFRLARRLVAPSFLALVLAGCGEQPPEPKANVQTEAPPPPPRKLPAPDPVLSRGDLVGAASRAASAYAGGETSEGTDPLVGRTFSIKIAFGCSGPAPAPAVSPDAPAVGGASGLAGWSWGRDNKSIELRMTPGDWAGSALIAGSGDAPDWEAVEGFWMPRPWLASDGCPNVRGDPLQTANTAAAPQTLGLAAIFEAGSSRIGRRNGRAYTFTIRPEDDAPLAPPADGYRLILEGRIASYPDGRAIRCRAAGPDQRPVCVVATKLDRVAFEGAEGKTLSEWRPG